MFLKTALRNLFRSPARTGLTFLAMGSGCLLLTLTLCLNDGILWNMLEAAANTWKGHIHLLPEAQRENQDLHHTFSIREFSPNIPKQAAITGISPRLSSFVIASVSKDGSSAGQPVELHGVDPRGEEKASRLKECLIQGQWLPSNTKSSIRGPALIGSELARRLNLQIGDEIAVMGQAARGSFASGLLSVVGLIDTGDQAQDGRLIITTLPVAQAIFNLPDQAHSYVLSLKSPLYVQDAQKLLQANHPKTWIKTWRDDKPQMAAAVDFWAIGQFITILIFYFAVALIALNTMSMAVMERQKEAAVLRAMGLSRYQVLQMFLAEGFLLGLGSALSGGLGGILVASYFQAYPFDLSPFFGKMEFGNMAVKPSIQAWITPLNFLLPTTIMLLLGLLCALIPALRLVFTTPAAILGERA